MSRSTSVVVRGVLGVLLLGPARNPDTQESRGIQTPRNPGIQTPRNPDTQRIQESRNPDTQGIQTPKESRHPEGNPDTQGIQRNPDTQESRNPDTQESPRESRESRESRHPGIPGIPQGIPLPGLSGTHVRRQTIRFDPVPREAIFFGAVLDTEESRHPREESRHPGIPRESRHPEIPQGIPLPGLWGTHVRRQTISLDSGTLLNHQAICGIRIRIRGHC